MEKRKDLAFRRSLLKSFSNQYWMYFYQQLELTEAEQEERRHQLAQRLIAEILKQADPPRRRSWKLKTCKKRVKILPILRRFWRLTLKFARKAVFEMRKRIKILRTSQTVKVRIPRILAKEHATQMLPLIMHDYQR